jgi:hypothetical protein
MSNRRIIAIALLLFGAVLLYFGYTASESAFEQVSEAVTGRFTDRTTWYLLGGAASAIVGLAMLFFGKR